MRIAIIGGLAALGLLAASPAAAGPVGCVWDKLPQAKRDEVMARYDQDVIAGMRHHPFTADERRAAAAACAVPDGRDLQEALESYQSEVAMAAWLTRAHGVSAADLHKAWTGVSDLVAHALTLTEPETRVDELAKAVTLFGRALGLPETELTTSPPSETMLHIFAYVRARGVRDYIEARMRRTA